MRIAAIQLNSGRDLDDCLQTCEKLGRRAADDGARWLLFPENAPFLGRDRDKLDVAQTIDGEIVAAYRRLAQKTDCWVTVGSFPERSEDPGRTYNTQLLISPDGDLQAVYRKMHLFDVELSDGTAYCESDSIKAGEEIVTATIDIDGERARVGLTICYDLRFPELYRRLAKSGADIITVPSAFTLQTGRDHWHPLLRARAIENQCWVIAPDQWGHHFEKRWSYGHTTVYDPWGGQVACAPDRVGYVVAEIDLDYLREVRERMPCLEHRRLELE